MTVVVVAAVLVSSRVTTLIALKWQQLLLVTLEAVVDLVAGSL